MYQRSLAGFYLNGGVREIIPIYPLYAILFISNGVDPFMLSVLFSIWAGVGIVLEVPSGALADTLSRKWLIVSSGVFKSLAFYTWWAWPDFYGYALGFILWGAGSALRSGAWEALLHDILASAGETRLFTRHYGRMRALATTGTVGGEVLGGVLIVLGYDAVLLVSMVIPLVASAMFAVLVQEPHREESAYEAGYLENLRNGLREAVVNPAIRYIVLAFSLLIVAAGILDEYVNPIVFEQGFSLSNVAFLAAGVALSEAAGQAVSSQFSRFSINGLLSLLACATVIMALMLLPGGLWVPAGLALFFFLFAVAGTQLAGRLQERIEGEARATVTSVAGLGDGVGAIAWFLVFGSMANASDMTIAAWGFAGITLVLCLLFVVLGRRWQIYA